MAPKTCLANWLVSQRSHANFQMFRYDTQHLSPNSAQTVVEGLGSTFMVHHIRPHGDGRDRYYAFQLINPIAVRVCTFQGGSPRYRTQTSPPILMPLLDRVMKVIKSRLTQNCPIRYTIRLGTELCKTGSIVLVTLIEGHEVHVRIYM